MSFLTESVPFGDLWEGGLNASIFCQYQIQTSKLPYKYRLHGAATFVGGFILLLR